jgi:predicted nucleic acid-binding protein
MNDDRLRQFIDTNILVYAYDETAGDKRARANRLMRDLWQDENGCLSIQVLQEFFVTVTNKIAQPVMAETAAQIIDDLGLWEVHSPQTKDILTAIRLQSHYKISFWDAMIIASAQQMACPILWSEGLNNGQDYGGVVVRDPFRESTL